MKMKYKRLFPLLALLLGFLGVVACVVVTVVSLSVTSRLSRTNEYMFDAIDKTLVAVRDRALEAERRVQESKITAEDIEQSLRIRTLKKTSERIMSRLDMEKKAEQLVLGLRQADQCLEVSGASIQGLQQALDLGSSLGAPVDAALVAPWLERIDALQSQLKQSTEMIDGILDRMAEITADESREVELIKLLNWPCVPW